MMNIACYGASHVYAFTRDEHVPPSLFTPRILAGAAKFILSPPSTPPHLTRCADAPPIFTFRRPRDATATTTPPHGTRNARSVCFILSSAERHAPADGVKDAEFSAELADGDGRLVLRAAATPRFIIVYDHRHYAHAYCRRATCSIPSEHFALTHC